MNCSQLLTVHTVFALRNGRTHTKVQGVRLHTAPRTVVSIIVTIRGFEPSTLTTPLVPLYKLIQVVLLRMSLWNFPGVFVNSVFDVTQWLWWLTQSDKFVPFFRLKHSCFLTYVIWNHLSSRFKEKQWRMKWYFLLHWDLWSYLFMICSVTYMVKVQRRVVYTCLKLCCSINIFKFHEPRLPPKSCINPLVSMFTPATGELKCMYLTSDTNYKYLHMYNTDAVTDESTTYRFTCYVRHNYLHVLHIFSPFIQASSKNNYLMSVNSYP